MRDSVLRIPYSAFRIGFSMPARFRVLMTDRAWPDTTIERSVLAEADAELIEANATDEASLVALAKDVDAIATNWAKVTDAVELVTVLPTASWIAT